MQRTWRQQVICQPNNGLLQRSQIGFPYKLQATACSSTMQGILGHKVGLHHNGREATVGTIVCAMVCVVLPAALAVLVRSLVGVAR